MVSCGPSERELVDQYELLARSGGSHAAIDDNEIADDEGEEEMPPSGGGGKFKLKPWLNRKHRLLGVDSASGRPAPLIDQVHRLMHLWQAGDVVKVNEYLDSRGLRRSQVFAQLIQALIEKSRDEKQNDECALLERLANHVRGLGAVPQASLAI